MAAYRFVSTWNIPAPVERVWEVLMAADRYQEWWPSVVHYRNLTPEVEGVGARIERSYRGGLPYTLRFVTTTISLEPPHELTYRAEGDGFGEGRTVLAAREGGTEITWYWNIDTTSRWMNWLAFLLRPTFVWNHNQVMAAGERGLVDWLKQPG